MPHVIFSADLSDTPDKSDYFTSRRSKYYCKSYPRALSLVAVESSGDWGRDRMCKKTTSFPELNCGNQTSVSLGNALSPRSYSARQEIESPVSKRLKLTKEFGANRHGVAAFNIQTRLASKWILLYHMWLTSPHEWARVGYNFTKPNDSLSLRYDLHNCVPLHTASSLLHQREEKKKKKKTISFPFFGLYA